MDVVSFGLEQQESVREFIEAPWLIRKTASLWVPPLRASMEEELTPQSPFFQHGIARAFLLRHKQKLIGRVLASVDHKLRQDPQQKIGHFGYFECIDDETAAKTLLSAAETWLAQQGVTAIHGPVNFNIMLGYRMQTAGFDMDPFLGEPRNPAYYPKLLEACGYTPQSYWRSWDLNPPAVKQVAERAQEKAAAFQGQFILRELDWSRAEEELAEFYPVALETFNTHYGFANISPQELSVYFHPLLQLLRNGVFVKAFDPKGQMIGYSFGYWDIAPVFELANGHPTVFARPDLLPPPRRFLVHTFAVLRDHRKSGVGHGLFGHIFEYAARSGLPTIGCLTLQGTTIFDSFTEAKRTYHVFVKEGFKA